MGAIVAGVALALPVVAAAQGSEGIEMKPAIIEDNAEPGQIYNFSIRVTNVSEVSKTFYASARDIKGLDDAGNPIFSNPDEVTEFELSTWVSLPEGPIDLGPNESRSIAFSIRVPRSASPGAHFGGIFLTAQAPTLASSGAGIGFSVGTIINLKIAGDVVEDAQLREFSTDKFVYGAPAVTFLSKVANRGNVLARPSGVIEVRDMFGKKLASIAVNESAAAVFPGSERVYKTDWEYEGFSFGRYQAVLSLVYGDEARKTISATVSFWVLPLKPILTVLGGLLAFFVVLYLVVRSYIRRTLRSMGASGSMLAQRQGMRGERSASRALIITVALFVFCLAFLGLLFFFFA